jgi:hypothetical protein
MNDVPSDWEERIAAAWTALDDCEPRAFRATIDALASERPDGDPIAAFERACSFDSTGFSDKAAPLYRKALSSGLTGVRRRRATIQLASSLRNLGQSEESVTLLRTEQTLTSDVLDDAVAAVLALALADTGHEREAVGVAVGRSPNICHAITARWRTTHEPFAKAPRPPNSRSADRGACARLRLISPIDE